MGNAETNDASGAGTVVVSTVAGAVAGRAGPVQEFRGIPFASPPRCEPGLSSGVYSSPMCQRPQALRTCMDSIGPSRMERSVRAA